MHWSSSLRLNVLNADQHFHRFLKLHKSHPLTVLFYETIEIGFSYVCRQFTVTVSTNLVSILTLVSEDKCLKVSYIGT